MQRGLLFNLQPKLVPECGPATEARQFLFDVSGVLSRDDRTGVYRVVSNLLRELRNAPPAGYAVKPVYADASGRFRYAYGCTSELSPGRGGEASDPEMRVQPGDIFFSADIFFPYPFRRLRNLKSRGLRVFFTLHDMIPLSQPQSFMWLSRLGLREWLSGAVTIADGMICVSRATADELRSWVRRHPECRREVLPVGYFHHGSDFVMNTPGAEIATGRPDLLAACSSRTTFLMVGTLAPHKGHEQVLSAFNLLWQGGLDCNLMIVGKEGWRVQGLTDSLRQHPERGCRLFWVSDADDGLLGTLYRSSSCLIAASIAEGFGLPLIEAGRYGLPIIARDIPVFREVAGAHALFFEDGSERGLTQVIQEWLRLHAEGRLPCPASMPWQTWSDSRSHLLRALMNDEWYISDATASESAEERVGVHPGLGA